MSNIKTCPGPAIDAVRAWAQMDNSFMWRSNHGIEIMRRSHREGSTMHIDGQDILKAEAWTKHQEEASGGGRDSYSGNDRGHLRYLRGT